MKTPITCKAFNFIARLVPGARKGARAILDDEGASERARGDATSNELIPSLPAQARKEGIDQSHQHQARTKACENERWQITKGADMGQM
eukprot:9487384-Pyramimonas_sp.AAC.1